MSYCHRGDRFEKLEREKLRKRKLIGGDYYGIVPRL